MKKILILGSTGKLGKVLVSFLLIKNIKLVVLVRNPEKLDIKNNNLEIIKGDVTNPKDLHDALEGINVVISVLGHGFWTKFPILKNSLENLIPLMEEKGIKRFISVSGAGLKTKNDRNSFTLNFSQRLFRVIDPYRIKDAEDQQRLLEKSNLNWTVVRTPVHENKNSGNISYSGFKQPFIWKRVSRLAIAKFIHDNLNDEKWYKKSPIIY